MLFVYYYNTYTNININFDFDVVNISIRLYTYNELIIQKTYYYIINFLAFTNTESPCESRTITSPEFNRIIIIISRI